MSKVRVLVLGVAALSSLLLCANAQAATVVVGSPLSLEFKSAIHTAGLSSTITNTALGEDGAHVTSPVTGTIVSWRTRGTFVGEYRLQVLRSLGGESYVGAAASTFQEPVGAQLQTFSTNLPIQAGDLIGLDSKTEEAAYSQETMAGSGWTLWSPVFSEGSSSNPVATGSGEVGFDAIVVPAPTVILVGPASGPLSGGTAVTIAGRDLEGATAVKFGPNAASANFTVDSDNEITAVAPPGAGPGTVDVTVTTSGGTSAPVPNDQFTYTSPAPPANLQPPSPLPTVNPPSCVVPNLIGKSLKRVRKALARANCRLGKVREPNGVTPKTDHVVKQTPKPGRTLAQGAKVSIKLG